MDPTEGMYSPKYEFEPAVTSSETASSPVATADVRPGINTGSAGFSSSPGLGSTE